jgi:RAD51-like protein 1
VFIDTEQKFSSQRLAEIAVAKFPAAFSPALNPPGHERELEALTSRVLVLTPSTLSEMLQRLNGLEEALIDRGVRLLVGKFFLLSSRMDN